MACHRMCSLLLLALLSGCQVHAPVADQDADVQNKSPLPERLSVEHLPNAIRLHEKVISGGLPEGDAAFAELQQLGVQTIISVDGAKPDVELAQKYGMRYIHLPHGYDGIPEERGQELAKAVTELPGPVYIHCHHGKHRSPTASVVACVSAGLLQPGHARELLQFAGTSPNYRGLYESAESARRLDDSLLEALQADFPAVAQLPPLAEAMVVLEHTHDHLKEIVEANWKSPERHPDLDPAHEALLLREHFTEMLRMADVQAQPEHFRVILQESEARSEQLEAALRNWSGAATASTEVPASITTAFQNVTANCKACHTEYRDVPLREKNGQPSD